MRILKYGLLVLGALFIGIQFVRPSTTNPVAAAPFAVDDAEVESILRRSCFDCHSNETRWPWYSHVAPVSWRVADHVKEGREHMNFSDWSEADGVKRIGEICEEIEEGEMPLRDYLRMHGDAKLSKEEIATLCSWSQRMAGQMAALDTRETVDGRAGR